MKIEPFILEQCYAHSINKYPKEACGLISGPINQKELLLNVHQMLNLMEEYHAHDSKQYPRTNRNGYIISPQEHMRLEEQLMQQGQMIKVFYHSHIDTDAYFSETDTEYALWDGEPAHLGVHYLVCSIKDRQPAGAILAVFNPATKVFDIVQVE